MNQDRSKPKVDFLSKMARYLKIKAEISSDDVAEFRARHVDNQRFINAFDGLTQDDKINVVFIQKLWESGKYSGIGELQSTLASDDLDMMPGIHRIRGAAHSVWNILDH